MAAITEIDFVEIIDLSRSKLKILPSDVHGWDLIENEITHNEELSVKNVQVKLRKKTFCNIVPQSPLICSFFVNRSEHFVPVTIIYIIIYIYIYINI